MSHHMNTDSFEVTHCFPVNFVFVSPANVPNAVWVNGLQTQFHIDGLFPIESRKKSYCFRRKTIGTGSDGESNDIVIGNRFAIEGFQLFHRSVCSGERLKVGDEFAVFDLGTDPCFCSNELFGYAAAGTFCELSASGGRTEDTAACIQRSIPVGTGKTAVQCQLVYLTAEALAVVVIECRVHGESLR